MKGSVEDSSYWVTEEVAINPFHWSCDVSYCFIVFHLFQNLYLCLVVVHNFDEFDMDK